MGRKRLVGVVVCALMAIGATSASASIVYVSNTVPVKGNGKSCSEPAYSTVQGALSAVPAGSTVNICAGTYTEQLEIEKAVTLNAINGAGTATLAMPKGQEISAGVFEKTEAELSKSACDTKEGLTQWDEISVCTSAATGSVSINNLTIEAIAGVRTCLHGFYGIFDSGTETLKANNDTIVGANVLDEADFEGCQHGVALEVGSKTPAEVGHAVLKADHVSDYEKNGPTVKSSGSTLSITGSTITGAGPSPFIGQNGIEVAFGAKATIASSTVSGNECNVASCTPSGSGTAEQASGVLFYQAAAGSTLTGSHVKENDLGVYYSSGSATEPAKAQVTVSKDVLTSNRYEGVLLEEGKALLSKDTINGSGRVGIDLFQASYQESASESKANETRIEGESEAAIIVESDKSGQDIAGKFIFEKGVFVGNTATLINESNNFEVIL